MKKSLVDKVLCFNCSQLYESDPSKQLELYIFKQTADQSTIVNGCFYCPQCQRYYPIEDTILFMLPDSARKPEFDRGFLLKYQQKLPNYITAKGRPHNLSSVEEDPR